LSNILSINILIMAVDKAKVILRLRALFPQANLSQKRLDALADKLAKKPADDADDVAIDTVINDFNEIMSIVELAREDDRTRTLEANQKPKPNPTPDITPEPAPKPADDAPEWAKALIKQNEKLTTDLEAIKTGNVTQTKKQTASDLFGKSEILKGLKPELKERWLNRINVDSETSFDDQIKELESEYSELVQVNADNNYYAPPAGGGSPSDVKADQAVVDKMLQGI
jgi:hypothetical protein